ncbi:MAG: hypothetical protein AAFP19_24565, partial [Bacteroidota bacterium]
NLQANVILNFLGRNSGTFIIEEGFPQRIEVETANKFPTQILNIGASLRLTTDKEVFHEISLSRLARLKSSYIVSYNFQDVLGNTQVLPVGYEQRSFVMSMRYEYGKLFGKRRNPVRFGLSGMLEPSFYNYKREVTSSSDFPIEARIISMHVSVIPNLSFRLAKRIYLDCKVIPRWLIADFGKTTIQDPTQSINGQEGSRSYSFPEIDFAGTVQLRYLLKEPKKRGRR